jgi:ribosomal protein S30
MKRERKRKENLLPRLRNILVFIEQRATLLEKNRKEI